LVAASYGLRPYPFYIGIVLSFAGLLTTWFFIRDTRHHAAKEAIDSKVRKLANVFWDTTLFDRNLGSVTQAGLINNLNDGMAWGLFPILLAQKQFSISEIGLVTAIYPAVWGIGQLFTGKISDHVNKKHMLFLGMLLQGVALLFFAFAGTLTQFIMLSVILGWGTAMVYPTFLATIAENTHPNDRAKSLGVFRLWRDLGYAIGAILTGLVADAFGIGPSIVVVGVLTVISSAIIEARMKLLRNNVQSVARE
jgi:MFS family permease